MQTTGKRERDQANKVLGRGREHQAHRESLCAEGRGRGWGKKTLRSQKLLGLASAYLCCTISLCSCSKKQGQGPPRGTGVGLQGPESQVRPALGEEVRESRKTPQGHGEDPNPLSPPEPAMGSTSRADAVWEKGGDCPDCTMHTDTEGSPAYKMCAYLCACVHIHIKTHKNIHVHTLPVRVSAPLFAVSSSWVPKKTPCNPPTLLQPIPPISHHLQLCPHWCLLGVGGYSSIPHWHTRRSWEVVAGMQIGPCREVYLRNPPWTTGGSVGRDSSDLHGSPEPRNLPCP